MSDSVKKRWAKMMMDTKTHYDLLIEENNDPFRDPPPLQAYMNAWDGQWFFDCLNLDRTKTALEIGIGTGRLAARVAGCCRKLTGIDLSPKTIARARENLKDFDNICLICDDFSNHIFSERFDVIYSSLTMMHFENKQQTIEKIDALLKEGGVFVLSIDKDQSGFIDMGSRKLKVFPDTPENINSLINASNMLVENIRETEAALIFCCSK